MLLHQHTRNITRCLENASTVIGKGSSTRVRIPIDQRILIRRFRVHMIDRLQGTMVIRQGSDCVWMQGGRQEWEE